MNQTQRKLKLEKKGTSQLPISFKVGKTFQTINSEQDPSFDFKQNVKFIYYNTQKEKKEEKVIFDRNDDDFLSFTIQVPKKLLSKTWFYNYQIGALIEQGTRKFTYNENLEQYVDEWNKQTLMIIFKIPSLPEDLQLSFSESLSSDGKQYFVKQIKLQKIGQQFEVMEQISLEANFIILKFQILSINDEQDSIADLKISKEQLFNQSNSFVFQLQEAELNRILEKLSEQKKQNISLESSQIQEQFEQFQCKFYCVNFDQENQIEATQIQNAIQYPYEEEKRKTEVFRMVSSVIVQRNCVTDKDEENQLTKSLNFMIQNNNDRQKMVKEAVAQLHTNQQQILKDSEGNLIKFQNFIDQKKAQSKTQQLNILINEMNTVTKELKRTIDQKITLQSFNIKFSNQSKKIQDLFETQKYQQEKLKQLQELNKKLVEEIDNLKRNQNNQQFVSQLQSFYEIQKSYTEKISTQNDKILLLEQQIENLESDQAELRLNLQRLEEERLQQQAKISFLTQQNDEQREKIGNQLQRIVQYIQKFKLLKAYNQKLQSQSELKPSENINDNQQENPFLTQPSLTTPKKTPKQKFLRQKSKNSAPQIITEFKSPKNSKTETQKNPDSKGNMILPRIVYKFQQ